MFVICLPQGKMCCITKPRWGYKTLDLCNYNGVILKSINFIVLILEFAFVRVRHGVAQSFAMDPRSWGLCNFN